MKKAYLTFINFHVLELTVCFMCANKLFAKIEKKEMWKLFVLHVVIFDSNCLKIESLDI